MITYLFRDLLALVAAVIVAGVLVGAWCVVRDEAKAFHARGLDRLERAGLR